MNELPMEISRFLSRLTAQCARSEFVQHEQDSLRKWVGEVADAYDNGWELIRMGALAQLSDEDPGMIERALSCLFVVGKASDVPAVEPFTTYPKEYVRKSARTCIFEMKRRR